MKRVDPKVATQASAEADEILSEDLLWGIPAIAKHVRRSVRQTSYLIETKALPVKKLGRRIICARKSELDATLRSLSA